MTGIELVTALGIASTAVSAVGAVASGISQSNAYKQQARMDELNAQNARIQAETERSVSNQQEEQQRRRARQVIGAQSAAAAQSGVAPGGSQALALEDSATQAELDALNVRYEGTMRARASEFQSGLYSMQASQNRANASAARTAGFLNAGASLLKGASSAYGGKSGVRVGN